MRLSILPILGLTLLAACAVPLPAPSSQADQPAPIAAIGPVSGRQAVRNFVQVIETVEPVAEAMCRARAPQLNCDFLIVVDDTPNAAPNAYQTLDKTGRPVIAFTIPLIAIARNVDEVAFILSHEAAHHIQGHIAKQRQTTLAGAQLFGGLADILSGGREESVRMGVELGAQIGSRTFSKDFELEADALGTLITARAGYNPLRGAEFFFRIPDPGNKFLGTHPANADRLATIQAVASRL